MKEQGEGKEARGERERERRVGEEKRRRRWERNGRETAKETGTGVLNFHREGR